MCDGCSTGYTPPWQPSRTDRLLENMVRGVVVGAGAGVTVAMVHGAVQVFRDVSEASRQNYVRQMGWLDPPTPPAPTTTSSADDILNYMRQMGWLDPPTPPAPTTSSADPNGVDVP